MKINSKILSLLPVIVAALSMSLSAQNAMSPYSKFGYGLLNDNATAAQSQMGGVGYAMNSGRQINVMNPASYAAIDTLTFLFDMGLDFTLLKSEQPAQGTQEAVNRTQKGGGLDYITIQVPIGKRFGASAGLVPFSSVGYSFGDEVDNGESAHQGQGGLNQLYLGFAGKVIGGLSVGVNASYLFGNVINDVYVMANTVGSTSLFENQTSVRDWRMQFGAQYTQRINSKSTLTAGVVFTPGKGLLGNSKVIKYDLNLDSAPDTIESRSLRNNSSIPDTWGAGLAYHWDNRLLVEADVTYQPWSKAKIIKMTGFEQNRFADRYKFALGAQYVPDPRGGFSGRIAYRVGGFWSRDYMMVGNNNVNEYGVSCGFGLPTMSGKTVVSIGFEYRHRQATPAPLLKENYFNVRLGVNFNELWFFQNKIR